MIQIARCLRLVECLLRKFLFDRYLLAHMSLHLFIDRRRLPLKRGKILLIQKCSQNRQNWYEIT